MLYEAIFVPEGEALFSKSILDDPNVSKYIDNWGADDKDIAIVALINEIPIGAIWGRTFTPPDVGYGFVDEETPEISMAVKVTHRNRGIGTKLVYEICAAYRSLGVGRISLSVDKRNRTRKLYERLGFEFMSESETSAKLRKHLT